MRLKLELPSGGLVTGSTINSVFDFNVARRAEQIYYLSSYQPLQLLLQQILILLSNIHFIPITDRNSNNYCNIIKYKQLLIYFIYLHVYRELELDF